MADKELKSLNFGSGDRYFPLPIVSEPDNDKIMMVVNGEWTAVYIPEQALIDELINEVNNE